GATIFELPNLDLNADNLNLDEQSGISLRADVPALDGEAELHVKGLLRELATDLVVRARGSRGLLALPGRKATDREILRLAAKLQMPENQPAAIAIESQLQELPAGGFHITGALSGRAEIDQKFTAADFTGRADFPDFAKILSPAARQLPRGAAVANFAGTFSFPTKTLTVKSFRFSSPLGPGTGAGEVIFGAQAKFSDAQLELTDVPVDALKGLLPAPWNQWAYNGRGQLASTLEGPWNALRVKGIARSTDAQARVASFTAEKFSFAAPFEWAESALRVHEAKVQATKLAYAEKDRWQGAADKIDAVATFEYKPAQPLKISGRFDASGGKFSSPDNATVGESFALRAPFELLFDSKKNMARVTGTISAEGGELLWGKFFGDLKAQKPVLDVAADYLRDLDTLQLERANLRLAGIGQIDLAGAIEDVAQSPRLRLRMQSGDFLPGGFYDFFLRDTYNRQYPLLDNLAVRGRMAFQALLQGPLDALGAEGELSLQAGELSHKSNDWQIGPVALTLPFQISLAKSNQTPGDLPRSGTLAIERARFAQQSLAPIKTAVSLTNNNLKFLQPVLLKLFGGEVAITTLSWPDLLNDPKRVSFSAELKRLQLEQMTEALHWPRFSGTLTGSIPAVQSVENTLRTQGEIQAELFGGRVRIGKLEIENPFSSL
ncbi:MAG TPA: hypothetical protein VLA17_12065, partial [Candidatus Limnocylindria bacterium]|nr:hypothetical protein [Candidatus Limnocylindria bacterium]